MKRWIVWFDGDDSEKVREVAYGDQQAVDYSPKYLRPNHIMPPAAYVSAVDELGAVARALKVRAETLGGEK